MKKYKYVMLLGALLAGFSLFNGCYYDEVLPEPVTIPDNQTISFSQDLIPIFQESCSFTGCHVAGGEHPNLSAATAYSELISDPDLINVQDPASSELYQWLSGNRAQPMPVTGVEPAIAAKVLAWIKQGAQNN